MVKTLNVLEGHSPIARLLKCDISYLWRIHSGAAEGIQRLGDSEDRGPKA